MSEAQNKFIAAEGAYKAAEEKMRAVEAELTEAQNVVNSRYVELCAARKAADAELEKVTIVYMREFRANHFQDGVIVRRTDKAIWARPVGSLRVPKQFRQRSGKWYEYPRLTIGDCWLEFQEVAK